MHRVDSNLSIDTSAATMSGPTMTSPQYSNASKHDVTTTTTSIPTAPLLVAAAASSSPSSVVLPTQQQQQQQLLLLQQNTKSDYLHYLTSYETMVRQQDSEYDATKSHIVTNIYRRVQLLGSKKEKKKKSANKKNLLFTQANKADRNDNANKEVVKDDDDDDDDWVEEEGGGGMLTYIQMRRCLLRLGIGWKRSYFPTKNEKKKIKDTKEEEEDDDDDGYYSSCYDDDDVSVLSFNSTSSHNGGGLFSTTGSNSSSASGMGIVGGDIIVSDAQLIMLLVTLVEMEEKHRAVSITTRMSCGRSGSSMSKKNGIKKIQQQKGLYLPDFILAYKLIIGGMQCIKSINSDTSHPHSKDEDEKSKTQTKLALCARLKQRTLRMLQPFGPNSKIYNEDDADDDGDASFHSKREFHRNNLLKQDSSDDALFSSSHDQGISSSLRDNIKGGQSIVISEQRRQHNLLTQCPTKKSKQPFSNKDMMKKVMRSKDVTLAKIMEEHELEIENVSSQLESLRLEELQMRISFQKRRMRILLVTLLAGCGVLSTGILLEKRYRLYLEQELLLGKREKERRMADARTIELLQGKKNELENKLHVMEGKIRYQMDRTKGMDAKVVEVTNKMNDVDMKWLIDKVEIERCQSSQSELGEILKIEQMKNEDKNEELVWCRSRLHSHEREINELEHVSGGRRTTTTTNGGDYGDNIIKKGHAISISRDNSVDSTKKGSQEHRPVYLEMKYNKSMRNAMLLRQTFFAVVGMAVNVILHGLIGAWMPNTAVQILGSTLSPPSSAEIILGRAEKVVDGIFGTSVAFLLIRAVVAFVSAL